MSPKYVSEGIAISTGRDTQKIIIIIGHAKYLSIFSHIFENPYLLQKKVFSESEKACTLAWKVYDTV